MSFLEIREVSRLLKDKPVLQQISLRVPQGSRLAVAGETGAGKSTLLRIIAGLNQADSGSVWLNGHRIEGPDEKLIAGHAEIAYLSQHYELRNNYFVHELLQYANRLSKTDAENLYRICNITHLITRRTNELSGGEKQRVAMARLLSTKPTVLLLDEPFAHLDRIHKFLVQEILEQVRTQFDLTLVKASHDPEEILGWADELIILKQGKLVAQGLPIDLFLKPGDEYQAGLLGRYNLFETKHLGSLGISIPDNKKLFVRPAHLRVEKDAGPVRARLIQSQYMGNYNLLRFQLDDSMIYVNVHPDQNFESGVEYTLLPNPPVIHFL